MTAVTDTRCPFCGEPVAAGDAFCESCGQALGTGATNPITDSVTPGKDALGESARTHLIAAPGADEPADEPTRACATCGAVVGADGYCTVCGIRASNGREHVVTTLSPTVAGVCDKGRVHPRNEDAMALAVATDRTVLIVCDGVSTSANSDVTSQAAAEAAREVLLATPAPSSASPAARITHWATALQAAAVAADEATATVDAPDEPNPGSCTFITAVVDGDLVVTGCVGDSRAYWLPDDGTALQLSVDDSWATENIARGVPREIAEADPRAHSITQWLGPDSPPVEVHTESMTATTAGWVLVCSDGLWNYCSAASDLGRLVAAQSTVDPSELAEALVAWANEQGGHDNITVALARLAPGPIAPVASPWVAGPPVDPANLPDTAPDRGAL